MISSKQELAWEVEYVETRSPPVSISVHFELFEGAVFKFIIITLAVNKETSVIVFDSLYQKDGECMFILPRYLSISLFRIEKAIHQ